MTPIFRFALKLAFGLTVLGVIAYLVDLGETFRTLRGVDPAWLTLAILCYLATRVLMGIKWWVLLDTRDASVSYATVQRAMLLSDFHGLLFPNTIAIDVLRAVLLRHHPRGLTFTAASIVADRVINLAVAATIALLALLATRLFGPSTIELTVCGVVLAIAGTVLLATFAVVSRRPFDLVITALRAIAARGSLTSTVGTLLRTFEKAHAAMRIMLSDTSILRRALLLAIAVVLVRGLWTFFLFLAIGVSVSPLLIITLMPIITMIALLPVSVLGLGLKDGAFVFFFGGIGVAASAAFAVSLASYAVIIGCSLVLGLLATVIGPPLPEAATKLEN